MFEGVAPSVLLVVNLETKVEGTVKVGPGTL